MQGVRTLAVAPNLVRPRRLELRADIGFAAVAVALCFALFHDAWAHPASTLIGVSEDPLQNLWLLAFTPHALTHASAPWFTTLIDAPAGVNLLWNPLMPLAGLVIWPVSSTAGPVVAYNLLATLTPALSTVAAYAALRYLVRDRAPAGIGALIYGFSPYVVAQLLGHPHAALGVTPPLLLIVLFELLVRRHGSARRNGLLLAALVVVQFFLSVEVLASEMVITAIGLAVLAVRYRDRVRPLLPYVTRVCGWALPPVALLCSWPLGVQLFGTGHVSGSIWPPGEFSADLLNLVTPSALVQFAPSALQQIPFHIDSTSQVWAAYLGIPLLALCAATVVRLRRRFDVVLFGALFAVSAVLSLGPTLLVSGRDTGVPLPAHVIQAIPGLGNLEADRFTLYAYLCAAILVAMLIADLRQRERRGLAWPLAIAATLVSLVPTAHFPTEAATVPAFFSSGATAIASGTTVLVLPLADSTHPQPMLWQATTAYRFAMTGGYAIRPLAGGGATTSPPDGGVATAIENVEATSTVPEMSEESRTRWISELRADGVSAVIVGPDRAQSALAGFVMQLLQTPPRWTGGVALWTSN